MTLRPRTGPRLLAAAALLALSIAPRAAAECGSALANQFIPLPIYATQPNEGSTWGVLPVVLRVCPDGQRTESIVAPSLSWNQIIHYTGTFRWYHYPREDTALTVLASVSTRTNFNSLLVWQRLPTETGASTGELYFRGQRTVFERFFGLGPDTEPSSESSYTILRFIGSARRGWNVAPNLNLGISLGLEHHEVESRGVPGLPLTTQAFPDAPGVHGATLASQGVDLRYDNRRGGDYAERGLRVDLGGDVVEGLAHSPTFLRGRAQVRGVATELSRLSGAARLYWSGVTSRDAPFYQQGSLGGSVLLRGFTEDRFVDRQAWTLELEQRIRVLRTRIFGVVADWRVDPFVATGQVFDRLGDLAARPRVAVGTGFRAFIRPNVVGRIDVAYAGEGAKVYVELGYPY